MRTMVRHRVMAVAVFTKEIRVMGMSPHGMHHARETYKPGSPVVPEGPQPIIAS